MMYIELDRTHARGRRELLDDLKAVLTDVRAAVRDWPKLQAKMREDAAGIEDPEGRAMLEWFADGAMTLLGYEVERATGQPTESLGIFSIPGAPTDEGGALGAMRYFEAGGDVPLMAKAERKSSVHRRRPDRPSGRPDPREGQGYWNRRSCRPVDQPGADLAGRGSAAPALRGWSSSTSDFGFDPKGHSGKALRHAVSSLPRDLLVSVSWEFAPRPGDDGDVARRPSSAGAAARPKHPQGPAVHLRLAAARRPQHAAPRSNRRHDGRGRRHRRSPAGRSETGEGRPRADPLHPIYRQ